MNKEKVLNSLNNILELELAGVVKYTHYAFMVQGPYRLSVVEWLREQAQESLMHAEAVGEHITSLGEHPTLKISDLLETHKHSTEDILMTGLCKQPRQIITTTTTTTRAAAPATDTITTSTYMIPPRDTLS